MKPTQRHKNIKAEVKSVRYYVTSITKEDVTICLEVVRPKSAIFCWFSVKTNYPEITKMFNYENL
jgi:hypothetical protein